MLDVPMVPTMINETYMLLLPEHRAVRPEWPVWEKERIASMRANIREGDVVFDIGAEEGDLPALWATWVQPSGGVVLVEPNPLVWPNIRAIWNANGLPAPLGWFAGFASDTNNFTPRGMTPEDLDRIQSAEDGWPVCAHGPLIGDHGFRNVSERQHDTPQITIDMLADKHGLPDAITMDIEGAELVAMRGAENVLRHYRPLVWISVHHEFMAEMYGHSRAMLIEYMAGYDYIADHIAYDHEEHVLFSPVEREDVVRP